jgi:predicted polyphosphate/ATP-dependent NAD kinase
VAKLGLIVNPIAGMGGRVGLKGTDGLEIVAKARKLGAEPVAPERALEALRALKDTGSKPELFSYPAEMGEDEIREAGFSPQVLGEIKSGETTAEDTKRAAKDLLAQGVDLILFSGGDGTARDILDAIGTKVPILGVPTGVKMFSAVFANTPENAGKLAARFLTEGLPLREAEVMDVDEDAFRRNQLESELKGFARTPYEPQLVQAAKLPTAPTGSELADQKAIARWVLEIMENDRLYVLGPGTTTRAVAEELGIYDSTLLGVDLIKDKKLLARDVGEEQLLQELGNLPATIIVSPIGKQGFILGRGNQQISPGVVRRAGKENMLVLATPNKIAATPTLKVDTGDPGLDQEFRGHIPVIVGYWLKRTVRVV